jgi:hypothetical protein
MGDPASRAYERWKQIREACALSDSVWLTIAEALAEFIDRELWRELSYTSLSEFLADPDVEMSRSQAFRFARLWRGYVEELGVPPKRLVGLSPSKLDIALTAVKGGKCGVEEALADAKALTRRDLLGKYGTGTVPERVRCPSCGTLVPQARLGDVAELADAVGSKPAA